MHLFFSVGEPSGDLHGANLITALKRRYDQVRCVGLGGPRMAQAKCELHEDLTRLAIMGFVRVLWHIRSFWNTYRRTKRYFRDETPDAVVLIDFPGFNWWIARAARKQGIPVFYYGTPQVWAWAQWRVGKMRRLIDHALCKLPFEEAWLRDRGVNATYIGHPYFDELSSRQMDSEFLAQQRGQSGRLITILPGSRMQEVTANLDSFLKTAHHIEQEIPSVRFAIAAFQEKQAEIARAAVARSGITVEVHVGRTAELIHLADVCLACSGSVSLELLYHAKPSVVHYRVGRRFLWLAQRLVKVRFITLVNLLAARDPFDKASGSYDPQSPEADSIPIPEYPTCEDKSAQMAQHVVTWLRDKYAYQRRANHLRDLRDRYAQAGASERAATYLIEALSSSGEPPQQQAA